MPSRLKQLILAAAGVAALALGGSALAGAASTTTATPAAASTTSPSTAPEGPGHGFPAGEAPGSAAHENSESAVTGADASKAQAAAVKSVAGTAGAVTSNFTKNGYEVTVTKSDGSKVIVHVDSSFQVDQGGAIH